MQQARQPRPFPHLPRTLMKRPHSCPRPGKAQHNALHSSGHAGLDLFVTESSTCHFATGDRSLAVVTHRRQLGSLPEVVSRCTAAETLTTVKLQCHTNTSAFVPVVDLGGCMALASAGVKAVELAEDFSIQIKPMSLEVYFCG